MEKIEVLKEKLAKAEAKKASTEAEIISLRKKIEQAETSAIMATLKEHNISYAELMELVRNRQANIADVVSDNE